MEAFVRPESAYNTGMPGDGRQNASHIYTRSKVPYLDESKLFDTISNITLVIPGYTVPGYIQQLVEFSWTAVAMLG